MHFKSLLPHSFGVYLIFWCTATKTIFPSFKFFDCLWYRKKYQATDCAVDLTLLYGVIHKMFPILYRTATYLLCIAVQIAAIVWYINTEPNVERHRMVLSIFLCPFIASLRCWECINDVMHNGLAIYDERGDIYNNN